MNSNFMLAIIESKWLQHLSTIIFASVCVAENISNGDPGIDIVCLPLSVVSVTNFEVRI